MSRQLVFDLGARPALGREDFFVSDANAIAVAMVDAPVTWPQNKLILVGPEGAGKSHLARSWAARDGAAVFDRSVPEGALPDTPVLVEDADQLDPADQPALFHLHNHLQAQGHALLLTAKSPPRDWGLTLPDLISRMSATAISEIKAPDDALLGAVLVKLLADRQVTPDPDAITYLLPRIERSFASLPDLARHLDQTALAHGRRITRPIAASALAAFQTQAP